MSVRDEGVLEIKRGTTPTITIPIPTEINLEEVAKAEFSITQGGKTSVPIILKTLDDLITDLENNAYSVTLTQEDTLRLIPTPVSSSSTYNGLSTYAEISILMDSGMRATSEKQLVTVLDVQKEGIMRE